jgi:hypothetical protein
MVHGHARSASPRWFERYDAASSSLALGARACSVKPGAAVAWLPSACLVARTDVLREHPFAEGLRVAEDVDLVWRLCAAGHEVRYEPAVVALHDVRGTIRGWLGRKVIYGTGGAILADRHGNLVAPAALSPAVAIAAAALLLRRRWSVPLALGVVLSSARAVNTVLPEAEGRARTATGLAAEGLYWGLRQESALLLRHWWPATALLSAVSPSVRRMIGTALAVDLAVQATAERHQLTEGICVGWVGHRLDDLAYGLGLWLGAARARSARCLGPRILHFGNRSTSTASGYRRRAAWHSRRPDSR